MLLTLLAKNLVTFSTKLQAGETILLDMFDVPDEMTVALVRAVRAVGAVPAVVIGGVGAIIVAGVVVGMAHMALSSLYDYWLQIRHIDLSQHLRHPLYRVDGTTPVLVGSSTCDATCQAISARVAMTTSATSTSTRVKPFASPLAFAIRLDAMAA